MVYLANRRCRQGLRGTVVSMRDVATARPARLAERAKRSRQGLKPDLFPNVFTARLKSCPDTSCRSEFVLPQTVKLCPFKTSRLRVERLNNSQQDSHWCVAMEQPGLKPTVLMAGIRGAEAPRSLRTARTGILPQDVASSWSIKAGRHIVAYLNHFNSKRECRACSGPDSRRFAPFCAPHPTSFPSEKMKRGLYV
jgi:hypothetical protein